MSADTAASTITEHAAHVHLCGRFGKGEERWTKTYRKFAFEKFLQEEDQDPFKVGKGDIRIHRKPLYLMEHRRVRDIRVAAIHPAWSNYSDWGRVGFQIPYLYR